MTTPHDPFTGGPADPYGQPGPGDPNGPGALGDPLTKAKMATSAAEMLTRTVAALRRPSLVMVTSPAIPSLLILLLGLPADGAIRYVCAVVGGLGLLLAARMWWLRSRFIAAVNDRTGLELEIGQALDLAGHVTAARAQAFSELERAAATTRNTRDARQVIGNLGLGSVTGDTLRNLPRVRPFLPDRLRTTFFTGTLSLMAGFFLSLFAVVLAVIALFAGL